MDIIVTTPKREMANAAQEAAECIRDGEGAYFRSLGERMPKAKAGDRVFYVEDSFIRGFCIIACFGDHSEWRCNTTGRVWTSSVVVCMDATTWQWIKPIPMRGFQGWRYFAAPADMEIIGGWLDPKPAAGHKYGDASGADDGGPQLSLNLKIGEKKIGTVINRKDKDNE